MSADNRNKLKQRIAPGLWEDMDGNFHWSLPELLALVELEDTDENRAKLVEMLKEEMQDSDFKPTIIFRQSPDDPGTEL